MVEDWIDEVAKRFAQIPDGKGGFVRSYRLIEVAEIPEALTVYPCAISYTDDVTMQTPDGGPNVDMWRGLTELHLVPGQKKSDIPYMIRFFGRVRSVFALDRTLGGKVQYCKLTVEGPSIEGPIVFDPNTEIANQGLLVHWVVRDRLS